MFSLGSDIVRYARDLFILVTQKKKHFEFEAEVALSRYLNWNMKSITRIIVLLALSSPATAQYISVEADAVWPWRWKRIMISVFKRQRRNWRLTYNRYAFGAFLPVITGTGLYAANFTEFEERNFCQRRYGAQRELGETNTAAAVQLLWPIFDGTRMFATRKRIGELAQLGEVQIKNQMMNSVAAVITNYYGVVRQKQHAQSIARTIGGK